MTGAARFRNALRVNFRFGIFGRPNSVHAVATHARRRTIVVKIEQSMAVRTGFEFRELVGWQCRIEVVHLGRIRMTTRAKRDDPGAIFVAIFLRPFLDEIVSEICGGVAAMTTGAGNAETEMHVVNNLFQVHRNWRRLGPGWAGHEESICGVIGRIAVAQHTVVLQ